MKEQRTRLDAETVNRDEHEARWLLAGLATLVGLAALVTPLAPDLSSDSDHEDFAGTFGTIAQVLAGLLVALVVEARLVASSGVTRRRLAVAAVIAIGVGLAASVAAMSPFLPGCLYAPLFGAAVAGGLVALVAVLVVAAVGLREAFAEHDADTIEGNVDAAIELQDSATSPPGPPDRPA